MTLYVSILSAAAVLAAAAACVDAWRFMGIWTGRIRIGRWRDRRAWQDALARKAAAWLKRMPAVPKKDQGRLVLWDMLRGAYADAAIQGWQLGGLSLGLNAYAGDRNDGGLKEKLRDALGRHELVVNYLERENPEHGKWTGCCWIMPCWKPDAAERTG
ncbi:hypothetical protein [Akkermansia sp.]|uniref:hypothetical protein n=1 Tax=Akkermansia sp. TaxID=1872421 RepID=UPI00399273AF